MYIAVGVGVSLLLLGLVFWRDIAVTSVFMYVKYGIGQNSSIVIKEVPKQYTLQPTEPEYSKLYTCKNIQFRIPFESTNVRSEAELLVVDGPEKKSSIYIWIIWFNWNL